MDLPIFFFVDPMLGRDTPGPLGNSHFEVVGASDHVDRITLSYLFFESDSELPEEYEEL